LAGAHDRRGSIWEELECVAGGRTFFRLHGRMFSFEYLVICNPSRSLPGDLMCVILHDLGLIPHTSALPTVLICVRVSCTMKMITPMKDLILWMAG
jgi:hypothetical protein